MRKTDLTEKVFQWHTGNLMIFLIKLIEYKIAKVEFEPPIMDFL